MAAILPSASAAIRSQTVRRTLEIVGDHEDREAEGALKRTDQSVELSGGDRIKSGRRLIQKHDVRIERQSAGEGDPLGHAAREGGG